MRIPVFYGMLLLVLLLIYILEARSVALKQDKTGTKDLVELEALQDLRKTETTVRGGKRKDDAKNTLKALTEEESDPASGDGVIAPEDY